MKVLISDPDGRFVMQEAPDPEPQPGELLVRVQATSINPRDLRMARAKAGYRAGVDFAGVVERAAGRGGPQVGARVAGVLPSGAWSQRLAVAPRSLAPVPDDLSLAEAAALASTGLTALYALERGGALIGRKVLITGATGAVGRTACQLAKLAGADVTGSVRSQAGADALAGLDVRTVVGDDPGAAAQFGAFDFILESVGGTSLTASARLLAAGGTCVVLGSTAGGRSELDAAELYQNERTLTGFGLFFELTRKPASDGLRRLFDLAAQNRLKAPALRASAWTEVNSAASMADRRKAVLELD